MNTLTTFNENNTIELAHLKTINFSTLEISVADTRIDIPLKHAMIFEKFSQTNSETIRQFCETSCG